MGLGGTAKKLQKVVDVADELYAKINDLRGDVMEMRNSIDETNERVSEIETELTEQRELLERLAEAEGVDTTIETAEPVDTKTDSATDSADESESTDTGE